MPAPHGTFVPLISPSWVQDVPGWRAQLVCQAWTSPAQGTPQAPGLGEGTIVFVPDCSHCLLCEKEPWPQAPATLGGVEQESPGYGSARSVVWLVPKCYLQAVRWASCNMYTPSVFPLSPLLLLSLPHPPSFHRASTFFPFDSFEPLLALRPCPRGPPSGNPPDRAAHSSLSSPPGTLKSSTAHPHHPGVLLGQVKHCAL